MFKIKRKKKLSSSGYTLIELILVLAVIALVTALVMPFTFSNIQTANLEEEMNLLVSQLQLAQLNAYSGQENLPYGVNFATDKYTYFRGPNLGSGELIAEIELEANMNFENINISGGGNEITFPVGDIQPSTNGTVELIFQQHTARLTTNSEGLIYYEIL